MLRRAWPWRLPKWSLAFVPMRVSPAGAIGVMQIMPRTGRTLFGLSPAPAPGAPHKHPSGNTRFLTS